MRVSYSTIQWFGKNWGAPICLSCPQIPVPIGEKCLHCGEVFDVDDTGIQYAGQYLLSHLSCFLKQLGLK